MKRASIVGLGDVLKGDLGLGCHVIEALEQEELGDNVELCVLRDDDYSLDLCVLGATLAIIVMGVELGGLPGRIRTWSYHDFVHNRRLFSDCFTAFDGIERALARADFAGGLPGEILFLWIEPSVIEGLRISAFGKKALRTAVVIIRDALERSGIATASQACFPRIYRLRLLEEAG
ncbi:MAG: hypothetical protein AB9873_09105 [Syntrophobacteraceae bacterium]